MLLKIRREKKYLLTLFALITISTLCFYSFAIIKQVPITYGTDLKPQWFEFYEEFRRLITNFVTKGTLPFYSWPTFLGNDFYASKADNFMGDIYSYIGLLLNDNFFVMASEITYAKFVVSGITFYLLLTEFDRTPKTKIICSFAYAFSGWAIFFSGQLSFLSFYSFVPLYILGIEKYLKYNKWPLYIASCGLLFATDWYLFYTLSIFTAIYFLYRYFYLNKEVNKLFKSVVTIIFLYILGSLLTAFIWLPGILDILGNSRVLSLADLNFDLTVYLNLIYSSFVPNYLYIYKQNVFETGVHYTREICLWASTCLLLLVPQFTELLDKKKRSLTYGLYGVFLVIAITPFLDSLVHGFGDPSFRWVFIVVIINLMLASKVLDNVSKINDKKLIITGLVYSTIMIATFAFSVIYNKLILEEYSKQIILTLIFVATIVIAVILIKKRYINIFVTLVIIEVTVSGMCCYYLNAKYPDTFENINQLTHMLQDYDNELNDSLNAIEKDNDKQFYRVYVPVNEIYGNFSHNMSLHYGLQGLSTYDSTFTPSFNSMLNMCDNKVSAYNSSWLFDIKDNSLMTFLNTKYAIVKSDMKMDGSNWDMIDDNYHYGFHLYKNKNYRPLGTTYSKLMTEDEYKKTNDTSLFLTNVIVNPNKVSVEEIKSSLSDADGYMYNISHYDNTLTSEYFSDKNGFMVMTIPYDKGWKILVDGQIIDYYPVNGGFIGFNVQEGHHKLEMYFVPPGFKMGVILTGISVITYITLIVIRKRKINNIGFVEFNDNRKIV